MGSVVAPAPQDSNFEYVSLLLPGNGTNGAQNNTFIDSSSNNFTVTRNGNTTQGSSSPQSRSAGEWSNFFDGTLDGLFFPNSTDWDIGQTSTYSAECWVFLNAIVNDRLIIGSSNRWWLNVGFDGVTNDKFGASFWNGSGWQNVSGTTTISVGVWYHIAFTYNNGTAKLYVNGTEEGSTGSITTTTGSSDFAIGGVASSYEINGYVSNVRVIKGGTLVYTANFTPSTTPLTTTANTVLLTCQNNRFVDNSSSNRTPSFTGTPSVKVFNPFEPTSAYSTSSIGGSGYWDGTGDYLELAANAKWRFGTGDFTIETYLYIDDSDNAQNLAFHWNGTTNGTVVGTTNFPSREWTHVAVTRTGTTMRFWINGVADASNPLTVSSNIYNNTDPLMIGRGADHTSGVNKDICHCGETGGAANKWYFYIANGTGGSYKGYMAGFRISDNVRYTTTFTPPTLPMTSDGNTSLLLNFINAGIYDAAAMNDFETAGGAQISTTQSKFGGSSMYFDGTGDYITSYNTNLYSLTTQQFGKVFTIEFWMYRTSTTSNQWIVSTASGYGNTTLNGFLIGYYPVVGGISIAGNNLGAYWFGGGTINANTWYHIAVVGTSTACTIYIDGTSASTSNWPGGWTGFTTKGWVVGAGVQNDGDTPNNEFGGYINDVRITNGVARYTANFTPPTTAFPLL